ncbi:MAG: sodium:solute symporter family protein, partial [Ignisphaera sp.]
MMELFIITLIVFFSTSSLIAFASRKLMGKGFTEFTVAGYRLGGFLSAMTYAATTYSAFMMVGLVGLSFATGVAALGFELVYLVATIGILVSVGPTIWMKARSRRWVSPSEMLGDLYGSKALASAIAILYLLALTPYLAAQFKGVGEIFQALGIDYTVGVTFMAITTFLWIAIAGIWSVATSDAFQGLWMIVTSIVLVTWIVMVMLPDSGLDVSRALVMLTNTSNGNILGFRWTINMFLGLSIPWIFFALTNPQVVQRLYIPRDIKAYRRMVRYFSIYGFIYTIVCVFLGLVFRSYVAISLPHLEKILISSRDSVTPTVLLYTHPILASTVFVGIVAAAISTSNSIVLS